MRGCGEVLALILGFMNALGIDRVRAVKADNTDAVLLDARFW